MPGAAPVPPAVRQPLASLPPRAPAAPLGRTAGPPTKILSTPDPPHTAEPIGTHTEPPPRDARPGRRAGKGALKHLRPAGRCRYGGAALTCPALPSSPLPGAAGGAGPARPGAAVAKRRLTAAGGGHRAAPPLRHGWGTGPGNEQINGYLCGRKQGERFILSKAIKRVKLAHNSFPCVVFGDVGSGCSTPPGPYSRWVKAKQL